MIKLNRQPKPQVLIDNQEDWTVQLNAAIAKNGGYSKIPKQEKEKLIAPYRHRDIKAPLFSSSLEKCAFCETKPSESGNIEVEHFAPKSKYPNLTFEWDNFLPACRKCNGSKDDHDSLIEPIVNPYDSDPDDFFSYKDIRIAANDNAGKNVAEMTISVCGLNSVRLMKPRADILVGLHGFSAAIEEANQDFQNANSERKRQNRKRKIREAIELVERLTEPSEKFSGFCKQYLEGCDPYKMAKAIVSGGNA